MNTKAQFKEFLLYLYRFAFLGIAILVFVLLSAMLVSNNINTVQLEHEVLYNRILHAGDVLTYQDPATGRYYTGIVDSAKLTGTHLASTLNFTFEKQAAARLQVTIQAPDVLVLPAVYANKAQYDYWYQLRLQEGFGAATVTSKRFPTTYYDRDSDAYYPAILNISIATPGNP